jgi:hypothetical protein
MEENLRHFNKLVLLTLPFPLGERSAVEGSLARHHYHAMKIAYRTKEVPGEKEPYPNQEDMSGLKQTARQTASAGRTYCQARVSLTLNFVAVTSQLDHLLEARLLPVHQSRRRFLPGTPASYGVGGSHIVTQQSSHLRAPSTRLAEDRSAALALVRGARCRWSHRSEMTRVPAGTPIPPC